MLPTDAPAGSCERHRALHRVVCGIESWTWMNIKTSGRLLSIQMREEATIAFELADSGESKEAMHADQRNSRIHCTVSDSRRSCVGAHPTIRRRTAVDRICAMEIASVVNRTTRFSLPENVTIRPPAWKLPKTPSAYMLDSHCRADVRRNGVPPRSGSGCYPKRDTRQGANASASLPATISPVASRPTTGAITTPACMTAR